MEKGFIVENAVLSKSHFKITFTCYNKKDNRESIERINAHVEEREDEHSMHSGNISNNKRNLETLCKEHVNNAIFDANKRGQCSHL